MPAITDLLPAARLAAIQKHMDTPEFVAKFNTAIDDIQTFDKHEKVNQDVPTTIWVSYGKDSMALWLLCELAEIEYTPCFIYNFLELPQHYLIIDEFHEWLGTPLAKTFVTEHRGIDYLKLSLQLARQQRLEKGTTNKPPITFFDPQEAYSLFYDLVISQFHWDHIDKKPDTLHMWSTRACEGMGRQWEFSKNGKFFQPGFSKKNGQTPLWRGLPIGNWQDLDVWAFLLMLGAPVSPIYGMHELSQRGAGRNYYPRTLWYCDPHIFGVQFCKWLKKYAPGCLAEVMQYFPEVKAKLVKAKAA